MSTLNPDAKPFEIPKPYPTPWFGNGLINLLVLLIAIKVGPEGICDIPRYDFVKSLLKDKNNVFVVTLDTGVWQLNSADASLFTTVFMKLRESIEILHVEWLSLLPSTRLLLEDPREYPIAQRALNCIRRGTEYIELTRSTHFLQILGYSYFSESSNYIESLKSFWEAYITRAVKTIIYDFLRSIQPEPTKATKSKSKKTAEPTKATKSKSKKTAEARHMEFAEKMSNLIRKLEFIINDCVQRQALRQNVKLPPSHPEFQPNAEFENAITDISTLCGLMKGYEKDDEKDCRKITYKSTRGTCESKWTIKQLTPSTDDTNL
jgi:hypothetical protein